VGYGIRFLVHGGKVLNTLDFDPGDATVWIFNVTRHRAEILGVQKKE
jgi:hypothetical protein